MTRIITTKRDSFVRQGRQDSLVKISRQDSLVKQGRQDSHAKIGRRDKLVNLVSRDKASENNVKITSIAEAGGHTLRNQCQDIRMY